MVLHNASLTLSLGPGVQFGQTISYHVSDIKYLFLTQKVNIGIPYQNGNTFTTQLTTTEFCETLWKKEAKTSNFEKLGQEKYTQFQAKRNLDLI